MSEVVTPVEYRVLIKPFAIEETDPILRAAKEAGIELPNDNKDREQMAQQRGMIVNVGGNAFSDWNGEIPAIGDTVMFAKYAGYNIESNGEIHRMLNDKDISAIVSKKE